MSDMPPDEFRRAGHELVDWVADYLQNIREYPVLPNVKPGDLVDALPPSAPEQGEPIEAIFDDFKTLIIPSMTHWNHPNFHAYFSVSASGPGILAELLSAALNINGMVWKSSPASTELEQVTMRWLADWMGLDREFFGVIFDTASLSTMHGIAAAREYVDPEVRSRGGSRNLTVYTSQQAHSSIEKGAIAIGIGQENVRLVPVDDAFRMRPDALAEMLRGDVDTGKTPCCIVPSAATTSTTSIDPIADVIEIGLRYNAWIHVDAAYGGVAAIVPEHKDILKGVERAHSLVVNPHKWLFCPVDLSAFYTKRPDILRRAFSLVPEYLKTKEDGRVVNYMDYGVPLGRRFRSLKLWFIMRYFGRERVIEIVRSHIHLAHEFARWVESHPDFELAAPVPLSLVCFRYRGTDDDNRALMDAINASGEAFLSHTVLNGRFVLRVSISNVRVVRADIEKLWDCVLRRASELAERERNAAERA
jgi:aromatic-L-amino-acid decarboxylase